MFETLSRCSLWRTCAMSLALFASWGCGGAAQGPEAPAAAGGAAEGGAPEDQAALGGKLYGAHCAKCHGASGEGGADAPAVVGKSALPLDPPATAKVRTAKFKTAADVAGFVVKNMPGDAAGSLKEDEYWAILAFDLKANGVDLGGKKIGPDTAASFVLHP